MIGIYKITNLINGHSYIGQSIDIERRWVQEINASKNINDRGYNYPLMKAFRKHGVNNFSFEIIEECDIKNLDNKEKYWINFYDTFFNGYNQTFGGDTGARQPKEKTIGIIMDLTNSSMLHKDIAEKWGVSVEMVQGINTGRYWRHDTQYPLQKHDETIVSYCSRCGKKITKGALVCWDCYVDENYRCNKDKPNKETLRQELYDCNGSFTAIGKKYGVRDNSVRKWCIKYGIPYHSSDYKTTKPKKEKTREFKIQVMQLDKNTNAILNVFDSISDACRYLNLTNKCVSHISDVCSGKRKSAYGYKWAYKTS